MPSGVGEAVLLSCAGEQGRRVAPPPHARRGVVILGAALATACLDRRDVVLPELGPGGTVAVAIHRPSIVEDQIELYVVGAGSGSSIGSALLSIGDDATVAALYWEASPEVLQLDGPRTGAPIGPPRVLPAWQGSARTDRPSGFVWRDGAGLESLFADLRLPPIDADACAAAGGCPSTSGTCLIPCEPPEPEPPVAPLLPNLTTDTCADGEVGLVLTGGVLLCEPPRAPPACPRGAVWLADRGGCTTLGRECPLGQWPEGLSDGTLFVAPGAAGGSGTRDAPYGTVAEALAVAAARAGTATIALAAGRYEERLVITRDVALIGACASRTSIEQPVTAEDVAVVEIVEAKARLDGLRIVGGPRGLRTVGAEVELYGVEVAGPGGTGLLGIQSSLRLEEVAIRGRREVGSFFHASTATISGFAVEATEGYGVVIEAQSSLTARSLIVRGGGGRDAGHIGVLVRGGARLLAESTVVEDHEGFGLGAFDAAQVDVRGLTVRDLRGRGLGVHVTNDALLRVTGGILARNTEAAVVLEGGARGIFEDVIIRDTAPHPSPLGNSYIFVSNGGHLVARRVLAERNAGATITVLGQQQPTLDLEDVLLIGTSSGTTELESGIHAGDTLGSLRRVRIEGWGPKGALLALGPSGDLVLEDLSFLRRSRAGNALRIEDGDAVVSRVAVESGAGGGGAGSSALGGGTAVRILGGGTRIELRDLAVEAAGAGCLELVDVRAHPIERDVPNIVERVSCVRAGGFAVRVAHQPVGFQIPPLALADLSIDAVGSAPLGESCAPPCLAASGIVVDLAGGLIGRRFSVRGASGDGVRAGEGCALTLEDGRIAGSAYALRRAPGVELSLSRVRLDENGGVLVEDRRALSRNDLGRTSENHIGR